MLSMFNKLGTRHCFGELVCAFDRCFNLGFYLAACLCEFRKIIFWSVSATCTCSRSSHLAVWPHNARLLNQEAAWVQVTWTTFPDKRHSGEQAAELRSMDNSLGGWLGEWVLHDTFCSLFLSVFLQFWIPLVHDINCPVFFDSCNTPLKHSMQQLHPSGHILLFPLQGLSSVTSTAVLPFPHDLCGGIPLVCNVPASLCVQVSRWSPQDWWQTQT